LSVASEGAEAQPNHCLLRLGVLAILTILGLCIWLAREPLLQGAADLWIVSDNITQADAAAVLGGDIETRPFKAAELYHKGLIKKILISNNEKGRAAVMGAVQGHTEANRSVLLKLGVPETAIETFGQANKSTRDEAVRLRDWAERHAASSIIIPTEIFAARRARWIFDHEFAGTGIRIQVLALEPPEYTRTEWWKTPEGLLAFQNEVIKYIYYRLEY
jgi:uncharacterized SAM-binding protein YcdF (DUF218 family)